MAAARASAEPNVRELVECPICHDVMQNPKSLPCLHTFCLQCLKDYWKDKRAGESVDCPLCRKSLDIPPSGLDSLPNNFMLLKLIEIDSASSDSSVGIPCEEHPGKWLELYCLGCETAICRKCKRAMHRQHECQEVLVVAEEFAKSLEDATSSVQLRIEEFQAFVEKHEADDSQFLVAAKTVDIAAKQQGEKIKNVVDGQVGKLLNEVREMKSEEQKEAKSRKAAMELAISEMQLFVASSLELRTKGLPYDVVCKANYLRTRASQLLETYVISDDPVTHAVFVPMNIDELTRDGQNLVGRLRRVTSAGKLHFILKCQQIFIITTRECGLVMRLVASVCVSVCIALSFESLDLESSFLVCRYIFKMVRSSSFIKVIRSRQGQRSKTCLCILFEGGPPSIETQSCCVCVGDADTCCYCGCPSCSYCNVNKRDRLEALT